MKRYLLFMLTLAIPLIVLVWLNRKHEISSAAFTILMLIYALFYHPLISVIHLVSLGFVAKKDIWKSLVPFWNWKYSADAVFGSKK